MESRCIFDIFLIGNKYVRLEILIGEGLTVISEMLAKYCNVKLHFHAWETRKHSKYIKLYAICLHKWIITCIDHLCWTTFKKIMLYFSIQENLQKLDFDVIQFLPSLKSTTEVK